MLEYIRSEFLGQHALHPLLFACCAIICARWALELGWGRVRQFLWLLIGGLLGPLGLLILYMRLARKPAI